MNLCPHCGQPALPRAESTQDIPRTQGQLLHRLVKIESKGEKYASGKQVRQSRMVWVIDYYREGA